MLIQQSINQEQALGLNITPQFIQSMNLLQMSHADLTSFLEEQMTHNPLMDVKVKSRSTSHSRHQHNHSTHQSFDPIDHIKSPAVTMESDLLSQLRTKGIYGNVYSIAQYLIGNLDEKGYLTISIEEVSSVMNTSVGMVEEVLKLIQSLEPAGIGARSLQECLCIQINYDKHADHLAKTIVIDYFKELASNKYKAIASGLCVTVEKVKASVDYIKTLQPYPGFIYSSQATQYIEPEAYVVKKNNRYVVMMNDALLPTVTIHPDYQKLKNESDCKFTEAFVKHNEQAVRWVMSGLKKRQQTLTRVIKSILKAQYSFLEEGLQALKPLTLTQIASELNLHESTVSRAIQNKIIQTPHGLFELKFFFSSRLGSNQGTEKAKESVKMKIRKLISEENKKKPLSDQQIAEILQKEGLQIARRTVMKYREELHILSTRLRSKQ